MDTVAPQPQAAPVSPLPATSPIAIFKARLSEKEQLSQKFYHHHFELITPTKITFQAGQYVQLTVPGIAQKKSYSIVSVPEMDHAIELFVDIAPQGPASIYLQNMQPGEEVTFMGPFGRFIVESRETPVGAAEETLTFVATGSGIAPMRAMIEELLEYKGETRPITLHWGLRNVDDQCWFEDFELLSESHPNFRFHPVLSQPPDTWPLCRGRVTDCLMVHDLQPNAGYYLCGNAMMIKDASELLVKRGVDPQHIHHEKFY